MKKSKLIILLSLVLALTVLTACTSTETNQANDNSNAGNTEKIELKFLHKWPQPENSAYFEEVVKAFEEENPNIKVNVEAIGDEPIKDKLRVLMGTDNQPDVFFSWSGEFANKFVRSNNALDLTSYLNDDSEWKDSIMEAGLEPFTSDGKNYGIPFRINGKFFVYNTEMFNKLGLTKPETWDQFITVLDTLKNNNITPIGFGNIYPWAGCHYITGLNQKFVPEDVRAKDYNPKTGEFTDPGYIKALEYFKSLNDNGYFIEGVNSTEHNMSNQMFYGEQVAMVYVELEEFAEVEENLPGKWDFFKLPSISEGKGNQNYLTGAPDGFMVSAKTKHPEEAVKFLKYLTNKENADKLVAMLGWPSPIIGAVNESNSSEFLIKGMDAIKEAEGMALWLDTDVHIKVSDAYLPNLQELLNGTKTPEQIMEEVQKVAKEVQSEVE